LNLRILSIVFVPHGRREALRRLGYVPIHRLDPREMVEYYFVLNCIYESLVEQRCNQKKIYLNVIVSDLVKYAWHTRNVSLCQDMDYWYAIMKVTDILYVEWVSHPEREFSI
jgi:hypothetical protein